MELLKSLQRYGSAIAFVEADTGKSTTYAELSKRVNKLAQRIASDSRRLVFILSDKDVDTAVAYFACLAANQTCAMIDGQLREELLSNLCGSYAPHHIIANTHRNTLNLANFHVEASYDGLSVLSNTNGSSYEIGEGNDLLLSTSGSTGSPKMVRLSKKNLDANAKSIGEYLELKPDDNAIVSLPFSYSYGLSVLNSHILAGATLTHTKESVMRREFWQVFDREECTSFAGVPIQYSMLKRVGFDNFSLPSLRTMTQAGGKLDVKLIQEYFELSQKWGFRFFVMYGQTEATARISYVPPDMLPAKIGAVGKPIPDGVIEIDPRKGGDDEGEIVYRGPNVMGGYAESAADLAAGDELGGMLRTADLGRIDSDGMLWVTGRLSRFAKVFGLRVNLAEVEQFVSAPVAAIAHEERVLVFHDHELGDPDEQRQALSDQFQININAFEFRLLDALPVTSSGKIDYPALRGSI